MSNPEDIPEDRYKSYSCICGGNISLNLATLNWECDKCDFSKPDLEKEKTDDN